MCDMVDFVRMQADGFHQVDLYFVAGRQAAHKVRPVFARLLGHSQKWRNIVSGVGVISREKCIVVIELADGCAICPRGPFCVEPPVIGEPEYVSAPVPGMRQGLCAGTGYRVTVH